MFFWQLRLQSHLLSLFGAQVGNAPHRQGVLLIRVPQSRLLQLELAIALLLCALDQTLHLVLVQLQFLLRYRYVLRKRGIGVCKDKGSHSSTF